MLMNFSKWVPLLWIIPGGMLAMIKGFVQGLFDTTVDSRRITQVRYIRNGEFQDYVVIPSNITYTVFDLPIIVSHVLEMDEVLDDDMLEVYIDGEVHTYNVDMRSGLWVVSDT